MGCGGGVDIARREFAELTMELVQFHVQLLVVHAQLVVLYIYRSVILPKKPHPRALQTNLA